MIDTDKYEGHTPAPWSVEYPIFPTSKPNRELIEDAPLLLAEVKRLRKENDELHAQRVQISWIQEARGGQSKAFELLAEVERLREENQRYLDFILWLGIEHKGKKLAWEYGDGKLAEMIE